MVKDGPLVLAVLVGQVNGRWSAELAHHGHPCRALAARVKARCGEVSRASSASDNGVAVGIAVLRQWRFVVSVASTKDTHALMCASIAFHPRRDGQRFLEHEVVAAAIVPTQEVVVPVPADLSAWPAASAGRQLVVAMRTLGTRLRITKGAFAGSTYDVDTLVRMWSSDHAVSSASVLAWPVAHPLANAMASGVWGGDVSVRFQRVQFGERSLAPTAPTEGMQRHFLAMPVPAGYPLPPDDEASMASEEIPIARPSRLAIPAHLAAEVGQQGS